MSSNGKTCSTPDPTPPLGKKGFCASSPVVIISIWKTGLLFVANLRNPPAGGGGSWTNREGKEYVVKDGDVIEFKI